MRKNFEDTELERAVQNKEKVVMNAIKAIPQVESLSGEEDELEDKENRDSINMRTTSNKIFVLDQKNPMHSG